MGDALTNAISAKLGMDWSLSPDLEPKPILTQLFYPNLFLKIQVPWQIQYVFSIFSTSVHLDRPLRAFGPSTLTWTPFRTKWSILQAERDDLSITPIIKRFDDRLNMISIDVENIQNTLKENKRWHQEINELRNDIALLSNQEWSFNLRSQKSGHFINLFEARTSLMTNES